MKIYSKFQDYYDSGLVWGSDPKTVYIRKTIEHKANTEEYNNVINVRIINNIHVYSPPTDYSSSYMHISRAFIIAFCGFVYPCVVYNSGYNFLSRHSKEEFIYSPEDVFKFIKKYGSKNDIKNYSKKEKRKKYFGGFYIKKSTKERMENYFKLSGKKDSILIKFHCDIGVPIFVIEISYNYENPALVYNPMLKNYKFYRAMNVNQTFQELSMFISGIMGGTAPPMVEISDKIRLEKHGFDSKISFRKDKQERKSNGSNTPSTS